MTEAVEQYGISGWAEGYFSISDEGQVLVHPRGQGSLPTFALLDLVEGLGDRGLSLPLLLRFADILEDRITVCM